MNELLKNLPEIIKQSASSPLGILALMIVVLAVLAFFFFKGASEKSRLIIFVMLFFGVAGLAAVIMRQAKIVTQQAALEHTESGQDTSADKVAPPAVKSKYPVTLAAPTDSVKAGPGTYKILSATLDQSSDDALILKFKIRYLRDAESWSGGTLMAENFRLIVDDVPLAPTQAPNEVVDKGSAKEGQVVFSIPPDAKAVVLQVGEPAYGTRRIPIDLKATKP